MDERQRQFAQFASALNQFAAGNAPGAVDRSHRDRSTNDGRSSTGSTSSGSSSIVSNNGTNVAAAVAAVAAGGSSAVWGELNRALQQYNYPTFTPGAPWPASQGPPPDFHRLGNFANYGEVGNDGRSPDGRSEGRRVPSKGETKATPPLPPGLAPSRGSTLASLQQLVNLPNEEVYRLIAAQQYAAAFSAMPASSRPQVSPGPNPSRSSISPSQMHSNISSRHHNIESSNQYREQYMPQQRYRQSVRNVSPLSNASSAPDRQQASPSPDNGSINGDYSEPVRREDRLSPHAHKRKELLSQTGHIRVSPNLMPKVPMSREGLSVQNNAPYPYDNEAQSLSNSRISDGQLSGSESEGDQKSRHRRKQYQPRRQTVIYGGTLQPRQDLQQITPNSVDSSSDDSQECDILMSREMVNHSDIPPVSATSEHHNAIASMSSAMSHALSHPFLAPHLNQPDRKYDNSSLDTVVNPEKKLLHNESIPNAHSGIKMASDLMSLSKTSPVMRIPDLIPCNPSTIEGDGTTSEKSAVVKSKQVNCVSDDYCTPVKKRKMSQPSLEQNKTVKSEKYSGNYSDEVKLQTGNVALIGCDGASNKAINRKEDLVSQKVTSKLEETNTDLKIKTIESSPQKGDESKLVNGDHMLKDELVSPTKLSDLSDEYYDCGKRRTRQKRPISYVEDETDPVQETNEDAMPLVSPTRRRGRRSKDKSDCGLSPVENVSFPSITVRDASLYEQPDFNVGRKLLQDIPEKVKEPLHIDTNIPQGSPSCPNQFLGIRSPDIYDFNDTDTECPERQQKKRGRKRGSPRKADRFPAEFVRSSPRKESFHSPKFFPSIRTQEIQESKKECIEVESNVLFRQTALQNVDYPSPIPKSESDPPPSANAIETDPLEQYNNNYGKKVYDQYSTISPTKLASLCQDPLQSYPPNSFHSNGSYINEYQEENCDIKDECNELKVNAYNNNLTKKRPKKRKRGRPKGVKSSPDKKSIIENHQLDDIMMGGKDSLSHISISEQSVNVSVAQFPSPRQVGRGRRKKRSKRNYSPVKSPRINAHSTNGPSNDDVKNENGRNTQNSNASVPDKSQAVSSATAKMVVDTDNEIKECKSNVAKEKLEFEGETMEDIEQFLKETAPSNESTPDSTLITTTNTSCLSTPSTSDSAYREARPKRISRPPPEGEVNDLLLLLDMDGEESDDEDYVPREPSDHGSDSRLSLTDLDEDSDLSCATLSPTKNDGFDIDSKEVKPKIERKVDKRKTKVNKKGEYKKKDELKKKTEEKIDRRGPYVRLCTNSRDVVVNTERDDDEKDKSTRKLVIPFHVDKEVKNVKVGFNSTLHPNYNAFTKDMTWYCAFCKMYSHHCAMGDLFGPYFINSSSPSKKNYPIVTEGQVEETISSPEDAASRYTIRRTPRHDLSDFEIRKSEVWESPPMRFVPSATPARMLGRGCIMRTPERGNMNSPRLLPGSTTVPSGSKLIPKPGRGSNCQETPSENKRPPGTECWIHGECLLWSSGVTVVNSKLLGLDEAVIYAQDSICSHCKESGATVCCLRRGCNLIVHVPCAHSLRWSLDKEFKSHCPQHVPIKTVTT